jgi:hypothetical protein
VLNAKQEEENYEVEKDEDKEEDKEEEEEEEETAEEEEDEVVPAKGVFSFTLAMKCITHN